MGEVQHDLEPLTLVEALLLAHTHHGAGIRAVAALAQGHLVHDRGAIDQPPHGTHVGPGEGGVVEDGAVLRLSGVEVPQHLVPGDPKSFRSRVEVESMACFVLHLGQQDGLALQGRRPGNPVSFRQHPDNFAVGVLADLTDQRLAVSVGHPVFGLDLFLFRNVGVKACFQVHFYRTHARDFPQSYAESCVRRLVTITMCPNHGVDYFRLHADVSRHPSPKRAPRDRRIGGGGPGHSRRIACRLSVCGGPVFDPADDHRRRGHPPQLFALFVAR